MSSASQKLGLPALIALVVGSMVGAGVFSLPATFGRATGVLGALIAWTIAGTGMLMLAFVFQTLAVRKPDLDAGVYAYAKAGFGQYLGFLSALGFWAGSCVGNVRFVSPCLLLRSPVRGCGNRTSLVVTVIGYHISQRKTPNASIFRSGSWLDLSSWVKAR